MATRRKCPITREQFELKAEELVVQLLGQAFTVEPDTFKSDSLGWKLSVKTVAVVDGVRCPVQIGLNVTLIGSKELP